MFTMGLVYVYAITCSCPISKCTAECHKVLTSEALVPCSVLVKREKVWEKRNVFSLDLHTVISIISESFGSEFQVATAEHRQARFAKVVVVVDTVS